MELTGKTEEEFKKWKWDNLYSNKESKIKWAHSYPFYFFPDSMKYGVYVDYFDSLKIYIEDMFLKGGLQLGYAVSVQIREGWTQLNADSEGFKSRPLARTAAIEKANEIRNEQLNK